ncbi:Transmembrane protein [Dirofilaria immitis]
MQNLSLDLNLLQSVKLSFIAVTRGISEVVRLRSLACFVVKLSWCFREEKGEKDGNFRYLKFILLFCLKIKFNFVRLLLFELDRTVIMMDYLVSFMDSICPPKSARTTMSSKSLNMPLNLLKESHLTRLAGFSGALAISLGAYGAHALRESGNTDERRTRAFETVVWPSSRDPATITVSLVKTV